MMIHKEMKPVSPTACRPEAPSPASAAQAIEGLELRARNFLASSNKILSALKLYKKFPLAINNGHVCLFPQNNQQQTNDTLPCLRCVSS